MAKVIFLKMLIFISKVDESNQDRSLRKKANFVRFWDQFNGLKNSELKKVFYYTKYKYVI